MNVQLLAPWALLLIVLIAPLMAWHIFTRASREGRVRFSTLSLLARLPFTPRARLQPVADILRLLALVAIVIALARPTVIRAVEESPEAGIDLVLALDVSGSMDARDLGPKSRLETAKEVMQEFLAARKGDRIGLVAFAAEAVAVSPLTQDYGTLLGLIGDINFDRLPQGTALGNGMAAAVNLVREGSGKSRVVILLTDGRSTTGDVSPEAATKLAQTLSVRTYTIGVGAPTNTELSDPRARRNAMDEDGLQRMASATGGEYFRAIDETALSQVYETIDKLEKNAVGTYLASQTQDVGNLALLAGALFLMIELLLHNTLLRKAT